jgi:hypothetical protein
LAANSLALLGPGEDGSDSRGVLLWIERKAFDPRAYLCNPIMNITDGFDLCLKLRLPRCLMYREESPSPRTANSISLGVAELHVSC